MLETIINYLRDTGFGQFHWTNGVMIAVGLLFIFLAIKKGFEPLLLVPIGFGILIGNIPYDSSKLPLGVYDGPVSEEDIEYYAVDGLFSFDDGDEATPKPNLSRLALELDEEQAKFAEALFNEVYIPQTRAEGRLFAEEGKGFLVNTHSVFSPRVRPTVGGIYSIGQGRSIFVPPNPALNDVDLATLRNGGLTGVDDEEEARLLQWHEWWEQNRFPELWSLEKQDPHNASVFWWLFAGVGLAGFYPPLIFLGIGALTDFGPMLSNPKTLLLGAAAQFGIFGSLLAAVALGFTLPEAASIGIIGGADGPTAIFTCAQLAPDLLGAVALAAYSYMAMVPIIQPPIIKLLTTKEERRIRMANPKEVSQKVKMVFPIAGFLLTAFIAPGGLPLLGMLFFGNLLRESLVTTRLMKTAQGPFIDIVTILLGVTVGAKTAASSFLTLQTIYIFIIGITAFAVATATGVLFGKLLNAVTKEQINPMIGAAGVSAVPMAARVVHKMGQDEDPQNFLLMHAMGPNVAGVIGSAVAAGVLLSKLGGV